MSWGSRSHEGRRFAEVVKACKDLRPNVKAEIMALASQDNLTKVECVLFLILVLVAVSWGVCLDWRPCLHSHFPPSLPFSISNSLTFKAIGDDGAKALAAVLKIHTSVKTLM